MDKPEKCLLHYICLTYDNETYKLFNCAAVELHKSGYITSGW